MSGYGHVICTSSGGPTQHNKEKVSNLIEWCVCTLPAQSATNTGREWSTGITSGSGSGSCCTGEAILRAGSCLLFIELTYEAFTGFRWIGFTSMEELKYTEHAVVSTIAEVEADQNGTCLTFTVG